MRTPLIAAVVCALLLGAPFTSAQDAPQKAPPVKANPDAKKIVAQDVELAEAQLVSTGTKAKDSRTTPRLRPTRMLSEVLKKQDDKTSLSAALGQRPEDNPSIFIMPGKGAPLTSQGELSTLDPVYREAMAGELVTLLAPRGLLVSVQPGHIPLDAPEASALGKLARMQSERPNRLPPLLIGVGIVRLRVGTLNGIFGETTALDPGLLTNEDDRYFMPDERHEEDVDGAVAHALAAIGRFDAAEEYFVRSFLSCRYKYGDGDARTANARASLARLYNATGNDALARKYAK